MFTRRGDPSVLHFSSWLVLLGLVACGGGGPGVDFSTQALGGGFAPGEVRPLQFDASNHAQIQFSELSGDEKFSLVIFSANTNNSTFDVALGGLADTSSRLLARAGEGLAENESLEPAPNSFHGQLRQWEKDLTGLDPYSPSADGGKSMAVPVSCGGGRGVLFKVLSSLSNNVDHETVCGIEIRRSDKAVYYVDETVLSSLDGAALAGTIDGFEARMPHEQRLLGEESDVDGSGNFSVLFSPAVNRLGNSGGGFVTGYFYGGDLFPEGSVGTSNEREVLFICVPDPKGDWNVTLSTDFWLSNIGPSVLPHEFQHMISFHQHVLIHNDGAEEAWANEGISHFIEDLDEGGSLDRVGVENPSRVSLYLRGPGEAPFTAGTSVPQRGGSYLFFRYLYEQANLGRYPEVANGAELLSALVQGPGKGITNIEAATGWSYRNLLLDFYATIQLSQTGASSDSRYNFQGISLFGEQHDNRGTVLQGLRGQDLSKIPFEGQVQSNAGLFLEMDGNSLRDAGQGLSFSAPPSMIAGGIVIRLQ
jgi:hypothetical protein